MERLQLFNNVKSAYESKFKTLSGDEKVYFSDRLSQLRVPSKKELELSEDDAYGMGVNARYDDTRDLVVASPSLINFHSLSRQIR